MRVIKATRLITTDFNAVGRRFKRGDIVIFNGSVVVHFYINENGDGLELLRSPQDNVTIEAIERVLDNSQDI